MVTWITEIGAMPAWSALRERHKLRLTDEAARPEQEHADAKMRSDEVRDPVRRERSNPQDEEKGKNTILANFLA